MKSISRNTLILIIIFGFFVFGSLFYLTIVKNHLKSISLLNKQTEKGIKDTITNRNEMITKISENTYVTRGEIDFIDSNYFTIKTKYNHINILYQDGKVPFGVRTLKITKDMQPVSDQSGEYFMKSMIIKGDFVEVYGSYNINSNEITPKIIILLI